MTNQLAFLIIALSAAIVLLSAVPSIHANAATMTPEIHKCIHDKIKEWLTVAATGTALKIQFQTTPTNVTTDVDSMVGSMIDKVTADVERCLS
jgi:hypothetical protein